MNGSEFIEYCRSHTGMARERAILEMVRDSHYPEPFRLGWVPIEVTQNGHSIIFYTKVDYFGVGTTEDWLRVPMLPGTAQAIANYWSSYLPTKFMVDVIWKEAKVKGVVIPPKTFPSLHRSIQTYQYIHLANEAYLDTIPSARGKLVAGHRKDIVLSNRLRKVNEYGQVLPIRQMAIYGWHGRTGKPVQGLNAHSHSTNYVDYSHGVRFVASHAELDGIPTTLPKVWSKGLLSDEGPLQITQYPIPPALHGVLPLQ